MAGSCLSFPPHAKRHGFSPRCSNSNVSQEISRKNYARTVRRGPEREKHGVIMVPLFMNVNNIREGVPFRGSFVRSRICINLTNSSLRIRRLEPGCSTRGASARITRVLGHRAKAVSLLKILISTFVSRSFLLV